MNTAGPLEQVPCANFEESKGWACPQPSVSICGGCRLVSYCSRTCQSKHWSLHKKACKSKLRSDVWKPNYVLENRMPRFISDDEEAQTSQSLRNQLWRTLPAIDALNPAANGQDTAAHAELNLAFVEGDIANLVLSMNQLPLDYSGKIHVALHDSNNERTAQNITLLLTLGNKEKTIAEAADMALHLWYSAFIPEGYSETSYNLVDFIVQRVKGKGTPRDFSLDISPTSVVSGVITASITWVLLGNKVVAPLYGLQAARQARTRVFYNAAREERWQQFYSRLDRAHRLAYEQFRRTGILLPFGAPTVAYTEVNRSLFTVFAPPQYTQNDRKNPLESWDREAVLAAGKEHGVQREDLYGALYFYLIDQLRAFAERIRRFNIHTHIFHSNPVDLAKNILSGSLAFDGIPSSMRFDRIDLGTLLDRSSASDILQAWALLLNRANSNASIFGHVAEYIQGETDSDRDIEMDVLPTNDPKAIKHRNEHLKQLQSDGLLQLPTPINADDKLQSELAGYYSAANILVDDSQALMAYLSKSNILSTAESIGLKLKDKHSIVPHHVYGDLNDTFNEVPKFSSAESFYAKVLLSQAPSTVRSVEFSAT